MWYPWLIAVGQTALVLAVVAYCGAKMYWRPRILFQAAAHLAVFAAVLVLGLLCFALATKNVALVKSLLRRVTRPIHDFASEFLVLF